MESFSVDTARYQQEEPGSEFDYWPGHWCDSWRSFRLGGPSVLF